MDLAQVAGKPEWLSLEDVDDPLRQHALSLAIDLATFDLLVTGAQDSRSKALALSISIPHAGDWLKCHSLPSPPSGQEVPSVSPVLAGFADGGGEPTMPLLPSRG